MLTPKPSMPGINPTPTVTDQQTVRKQRGTGFTNIGRILGANVGAGQRMGETIGGSLEEQSKKIRQGIEQGKSEFQSGVSEQTKKAQDVTGKARDVYGNIISGEGMASTPGAAEAGTALRDIQYAGPSQIKNIGELQGQASNLAALGRLAGFSGGQEQLLRSQIAKRGGYGLGQSSLDQLLLGQGGQSGLQRGSIASTGVSQLAEQEQKSAEQQAQTAARGIEANKLATLQEFQKGLTGEQGLQTLAKQRAETYASNADRMKELLSGVDSSGKKIKRNADTSKGETELTPQDEILLSQMGEMGIPINREVYGGDTTQLAATLRSVGEGISSQKGGLLYQSPEEQRKAQDLGTLIGGSETGKQIGTTQYEKNIYKGNEEAFGAAGGAKEKAMTVAKEQDMAPVNKLLSHGIGGDADWMALNEMAPGVNDMIDQKYDAMTGRGDNTERVDPKTDAIFNKYAELAGVGPGSAFDEYINRFGINRQEYKNIIGKGMAVEKKQKIDQTDYSKDPRIASKNINVFDALRQQLGLPAKTVKEAPAPSKTKKQV